ncbi:MAG: prepilin peptidase [Candidatus Krumholzibacteria bacterium]|nr:prepilin peptidase [Candidatus Krumholzibacteria bacterium]
MPYLMQLGLAVGLGACLGSLSNVLIYRLPRNMNVVRGRSHCPSCGAVVAWYDNIPIFSWLLLTARCRHCRTVIPLSYIAVELAGAACALVGIWRFGWSVEALSAAFFLLVLLDIALVDWQHMVIPHTLTVVGSIVGLVLSFFTALSPWQAVLGAATGAGIILAISWGYKVVRGVVGMGGGDVMLMGMMGFFLGPWRVLAVLFGGALLGTVYVLTAGRAKLQGSAKLPFGTFLAAAAAIILLFGSDLLAIYWSWF